MKYKTEFAHQYKALKMNKLNEDKSISEQCMVAYAAQAQRSKPTQGSTASMLTLREMEKK